MTGAAFDRANSRQDWETPPELMAAIGPMTWDLACTEQNKKAPDGYSEIEDSLKQDWSKLSGNLWLNPPYSNIAPWAEKCATNRGPGSRIFLLIPASVGSNYWAKYIDGNARVLFLSPRLKFVGATDPYPKDCALCVFGPAPGYECWRWKP